MDFVFCLPVIFIIHQHNSILHLFDILIIFMPGRFDDFWFRFSTRGSVSSFPRVFIFSRHFVLFLSAETGVVCYLYRVLHFIVHTLSSLLSSLRPRPLAPTVVSRSCLTYLSSIICYILFWEGYSPSCSADWTQRMNEYI